MAHILYNKRPPLRGRGVLNWMLVCMPALTRRDEHSHEALNQYSEHRGHQITTTRGRLMDCLYSTSDQDTAAALRLAG